MKKTTIKLATGERVTFNNSYETPSFTVRSKNIIAGVMAGSAFLTISMIVFAYI